MRLGCICRSFLLLVLGLAAVCFAQSKPVQRPGYTGDPACLSCHAEQSSEYLHTAHHLTSQLPSSQSIQGSFAKGWDTLTIVEPAAGGAEPGLFFRMTARSDGFFESAYTGFGAKLQERTQRIDLVTGLGKRGQTYLLGG